MAARIHLPRSHRIARRSQFSRTMKLGRRSGDAYFSIYATANHLPHARLGLTVARRVSARAVARNRIKRQIRESFRCHQLLLAGLDVIVVARPAADADINLQLQISLKRQWEQISQLCSATRFEPAKS